MKKTLALILALVMLFAMAACGGKTNDTPANDPVNTPANTGTATENNGAAAENNSAEAEKPNGPAVYTYEEDRGDFKVTWELTMYPNGIFYLNETHGLSGNVTEHSGNTWRENDNGTISTGPWSNADVDKSEFFQPTGECTWIVNEDGTMEPTDFVAAPVGAGSVYTYSENRGDFSVEWSLTLNEDGTYTLDEVHGLSGNLTTHTGQTWTDNGDGTLTTGAWDVDENKSEFFKPNGECTWILNDDGTMTPADAGESGGASTGVQAGKYTYIEAKGPGNFQWDILLMGNGNCRIDETNPSGEVTEHVAAGWVDNGDGTVTTGEWENKEVDKSDFFKPTGEATWKITGEGTCEPVTGDAPAATTEINPGKYTYAEDHGAFQITFDVLLMGNGNCRIDETHGMSGNVTEHVASGWTDNGDGTVTTGEWEDSSGDKSDFFKPNGEAVWKINADGTCEPVVEEKEEAPASSVNPGKYMYVDGETTWEVKIMGNGNCVVSELNTATSEVIKEHTTRGSAEAKGWVDNGDGTFETDEWEPEEREDNKPKFASPNGVTNWKVTGDGTCEPTEKKEEASSVAYGRYLYHDTTRDEYWAVMIMGNGNCTIQKVDANGELIKVNDQIMDYPAKGFRVNDDGTFTSFSMQDETNIPEFLSGTENGIATWKVVDAEKKIVEMVVE